MGENVFESAWTEIYNFGDKLKAKMDEIIKNEPEGVINRHTLHEVERFIRDSVHNIIRSVRKQELEAQQEEG